MKKKDWHNGSSDELTRPSITVSEGNFARMTASAKVKPSDSEHSPLCPPLTTITNVSSPSLSPSNTSSVPEMASPPNCSRVLPMRLTPSFSAASNVRTNWGSRDTHLSATPSGISNDPSWTTSSTKEDVLLTSVSSVELMNLNKEWRGW